MDAPIRHQARMEQAARQTAQAALGRPMVVRTGPNTRVSGRIVLADFHGWRRCPRSAVVQWTVTLEHESGARWGPYIVEALPRRGELLTRAGS